MKRLFWFGLGVLAGVRLTRRGNAAVQALKTDPLRELDRWVRLATPIVQRLIRSARASIEN